MKRLVAGLAVVGLILMLGTNCKKTEEETPGPEQTLPTSLHGTTYGMKYWYEVAQPQGFYQFTQIPYDSLGCYHCHIDVEEHGCTQCHETPGDKPAVDKCYACHGREKKESMFYSDVHRDAGLVCADCHKGEEVHGDGNHYNTMYVSPHEPRCENCHDPANLPQNAEHAMHLSNLHCTACHAQAVISCYSCHFQSMTEYGIKLAYGVLKDWIFLANNPEGKVQAAILMPLEYGEGKTFMAIGRYVPHTITKENARHCSDCHDNMAAQEYLETGEIVATWWNPDSARLEHLTGVIPIPPDYQQSLKFTYMQCVSGCDDPNTAQWEPIQPEGVTNAWQMLDESCEPLTREQIEALAEPH